MRIVYLRYSLAGLAMLAVAALSVPFIGSLGPNNRALASLAVSGRAIDVSDMPPGTFLEKHDGRNRYFFVRDFDKQLRVYSIPYRDGTYWIADLRWFRPFFPCTEFGPDADGHKLVKGGAFRCRDEAISDWWRKETVWDYSGQSRGEQSEDMPEAEYELRNDILVLTRGVAPLQPVASANQAGNHG